MRRAAALLLLAALGSCAWRPFGEPSDGKIRPVQALNDAGRSEEVVAALTPAYIAGLRGTDLRQAYVLLGDNLAALGRVDQAVGVYQLGATLFPRNVDLMTRLGGLLHRAGLDDQARPLFAKALEFEPRHFGAHRGLAEIERSRGSLDRAAQHYEVALETLDREAVVWREYAEVLLESNEHRTADLALKRALVLEPRHPEAHVLLAFAKRAQGDLAAAAASLDEALALGADAGARRAKALWLLEAGRHAEARAEAEVLLSSAPGDAAALWVRARARLAEGERSRALADLAAIKGGMPERAAAALLESLRGPAL